MSNVHRQTIPAFEKLGQRFGPYTQTIVIEENHISFYLDAPPEAPRSQHGHLHPHAEIYPGVSGWGSSWWPGYQNPGLFRQAAKEGNIDALLFMARAFTSESIRPRDQDAYCRVEDWNAKDDEEKDDQEEIHA